MSEEMTTQDLGDRLNETAERLTKEHIFFTNATIAFWEILPVVEDSDDPVIKKALEDVEKRHEAFEQASEQASDSDLTKMADSLSHKAWEAAEKATKELEAA